MGNRNSVECDRRPVVFVVDGHVPMQTLLLSTEIAPPAWPYILDESKFLLSLLFMWLRRVFTVVPIVAKSIAAPPGFPASGNGLWYKGEDGTPEIRIVDQPLSDGGAFWSRTWLPLGNGYLGAMTPGGTSQEITQLNIESLWSAFLTSNSPQTYNGGNKQPNEAPAMAIAMQQYRQAIFSSPTGNIDNIDSLATDPGAYGSFAGAGYLISTLNTTGPVSDYGRWLDLDQGISRTTWSQNGTVFIRETFCSNPTQACTHHISARSGTLPSVSVAFSSALEDGLPTPNITCLDSSTLRIRGTASLPGMLYELLFRVRSTGGKVTCTSLGSANATVLVSGHATETWITWVGETEFDQNAGDLAHGFSFRGPDPHATVLQLINDPAVSKASYTAMRSQHFADFGATFGKFELSLGQTPQLSQPTDSLIAAYQIDQGNPYLEWLMFNYGRYLLGSSARGILPSNLGGVWGLGYSNAWSFDYHSNINIQMNYWSAEMSNLDVTSSLFNYFEKNWAPRGAYTAQVLYNISRGWVTHNEMNIFGHTGMKYYPGFAEWANYPESGPWMAIHIWDHYEVSQDTLWWRTQGWPLIKAIAGFHLDKLIPDEKFHDGTLVVAPCNSPEQAPITFGCAHAQQLIWQLFNSVEKGFAASGDTDTAFLEEVRAKKAAMDKGLRIGRWGQLQEWKVDQDSPTDTHRHLSHLIGLYPGYAIASFDQGTQGNLIINGSRATYNKAQIIDATTVSLVHRGNGTGPDADSGWEKMWRAAAWAQLKNPAQFYHELTYGIYENFAENLFSLYNPFDATPIFQIDANLGLPAAILNALLQAPDVEALSTPLTITLLPALPATWSTGFIKGARVRGGITVDLAWTNSKPTRASFQVDAQVVSRPVQVVFGNKMVTSFKTSGGFRRTMTSF
ncbi:Glycoside hydrolase family 95 protein [Mycena indigotica]|uniref:Glycoside hydrolase family 95 protein n=1 Tax=Mycena indigotica TaxID=2126181 RepID=A0A8H6SQW6_9AGAR|nr:Glycoside hydrolase family 95 protein [Mycena indigotica]KAF7303769.1 Glycoside hydrolase family 95 protein [Mycena indigotica]